MLNQVRDEAALAMRELLDVAKCTPGDIVVVGCSTSEVAGQKIGTHPGPDIAAALLDGLLPVLDEAGLYLAAQCCEHLGRALVLPGAALAAHGLARVNAVPQPKAGGSFATAAFARLPNAMLTGSLQGKAAAGLDIGQTLIGMHLRPVVVPVRPSQNRIGEAPLVAARTRPPFVGGSRAVYDEKLL